MSNSAQKMTNNLTMEENKCHLSDTSQVKMNRAEGEIIDSKVNSNSVEKEVVSSFSGLIEGTALGDSLALPYEGLSHKTIIRSFSKSLNQSFFCGYGMLSDNTDQTVLVAQSLIAGRNDPQRFLRSYARRYRYWILCFPPGSERASVRAGIKLLLGFSPRKSGVFSAGNAPAIRSGIIGAYYYNQSDRRRQFVQLATEMTHTDPKALIGARAVAEVAALIVRRKMEGLQERPDLDSFIELLTDLDSSDSNWMNLLAEFRMAFEKKENPLEFARRIGAEKGVSAHVYQTVPVALYIWYYNYYFSFEEVMADVIICGGDTDSVGAIVGALSGCLSHPSMIEKLPLTPSVSDQSPSKEIFSDQSSLNTKTKLSKTKLSKTKLSKTKLSKTFFSPLKTESSQESKILFSPVKIYKHFFYRERGHFALVNHLVPFNDKGRKWRNRILDFPYSMGYLDRLSASLFHSKYEENIPVPFWHLFIRPIRNLIFLFLLLGHVVWRLRYVAIKIFDPRDKRYQKNFKKLLDRQKQTLQEIHSRSFEGKS